MIVCQNCKSEEPDGTIFCSECGTQLLESSTQTHKFEKQTEELESEAQVEYEKAKKSGTWISLHLLDSGHILSFSDKFEFTLGRLSDNQPVEPDVDLTPYKAFDNGVSRLHSVIRRIDDSVFVVDLGSSNGTYVNGIRILPNAAHPIRHGDIVALGKMKMQVALSFQE